MLSSNGQRRQCLWCQETDRMRICRVLTCRYIGGVIAFIHTFDPAWLEAAAACYDTTGGMDASLAAVRSPIIIYLQQCDQSSKPPPTGWMRNNLRASLKPSRRESHELHQGLSQPALAALRDEAHVNQNLDRS